MSTPVSRRSALAAAAGAIAAPFVPHAPSIASPVRRDGQSSAQRPERRRTLRFAHLTDIHVQPERRAAEGMTACLRHVAALDDRPELVVTGGDLIMDGFAQREARTAEQWRLWETVLRDECGIPAEHCLGNHDIWGWNRAKSGTSGDEARWGKKWAMEVLGCPRPYRSFDRGGWHFVVLDSTAPSGDGYVGRLDEEQFAWLDEDLGRVPAGVPVVVVTHIPIVSITPLVFHASVRDETWHLDGSMMHLDANAIRGLFARHGNVRLALSGHIHKLDRVELDGVTYICDGAVSGAWWKGPGDRCPEGYGVVDLHDDGSFEHRYVAYGWKAEA